MNTTAGNIASIGVNVQVDNKQLIMIGVSVFVAGLALIIVNKLL